MSNLKKFRMNRDDNAKKNVVENWKRRAKELMLEEIEDDDIDFDVRKEGQFQSLNRD